MATVPNMADAEFARAVYALHLWVAVEHSEGRHCDKDNQQQTGYTTTAKLYFTHLL